MFRTPLRCEAIPPHHWVLTHELIWKSTSEYIVVPAQFKTDLASIPRPLRWLLNQNGLSRKAAVLHDHLYRTGLVPRAEADAIFRRALKEEGMGWFGRSLYWAGVRLGGWTGYNRST